MKQSLLIIGIFFLLATTAFGNDLQAQCNAEKFFKNKYGDVHLGSVPFQWYEYHYNKKSNKCFVLTFIKTHTFLRRELWTINKNGQDMDALLILIEKKGTLEATVETCIIEGKECSKKSWGFWDTIIKQIMYSDDPPQEG